MVLFLTMEIEVFKYGGNEEEIKVTLPDGGFKHEVESFIRAIITTYGVNCQIRNLDNKFIFSTKEGCTKTKFVLLTPCKGETWEFDPDLVKQSFSDGSNLSVEVITKTD